MKNFPSSARARRTLIAAILLTTSASFAQAQNAPAPALEAGWQTPPNGAKLRAYWWWLNGNVTKASITRDLEEMRRQGFGGALICDADGASQDGNAKVPHGPTFSSPAWRELYKHALHEAQRLGLEMSLNIQSGWNLGGPSVRAADAAKKLVWSQIIVRGGAKITEKLAEPAHQDAWYQDQFVVAYRAKTTQEDANFAGVTSSSHQPQHEANSATDGDNSTFWVSSGMQAGEGPTRVKPQWLRWNFRAPIRAERFTLQGRAGYGPRAGEVQVSDDGTHFRSVKTFTVNDGEAAEIRFAPVTAKSFRLAFFNSYDPNFKDNARNVQIVEARLMSQNVTWPAQNTRAPIRNLAEKAMQRSLSFSAPDTSLLLSDISSTPGEADANAREVIDLSAKMNANGILNWDAPTGDWEITRFGATVGDHSRVSTSSEGWGGYALDVLDEGAFRRYWDAVVEPLIQDAGPLAGTTLKYLHTDSWEVEAINWTPTLRAEFRARRGYDLLPWLPVLSGAIINDREQSNRFLDDFRKTLGDLAVAHHYQPFVKWAHAHHLEIHPESGGPHASPIDAQRSLGQNDVPMSEFWASSPRHRVTEADRFFVKQPASAAHTYGKNLVAAEGFTTIGPHWQETLWDNLKPAFDTALTEGLNRLVWHAFVCSPESMGMPGQQYFAGTHFNPNTTWWNFSAPFLSYINRSQWLMQQGIPVSDVAYYYGDHVPNFAQLRASDPAKIGQNYDYDVMTEEVILQRLSVRAGRLVLPDGVSYRVLVLPNRTKISLPVLRRLQVLARAGATIIGPQPDRASNLSDYPRNDAEVQRIADKMWRQPRDKFGKGRVISGQSALQVLASDKIAPDFASDEPSLHYIHRRAGDSEIYFVANRSNATFEENCTFRVSGKAPELWNAVTGERRFATDYTEKDGRVTVPLLFAPYASWFVIFRAPSAAHPANGQPNALQWETRATLDGEWLVDFDPKWGGPRNIIFEKLESWTRRFPDGIRYYSGTATYRKTFDIAPELLAEKSLLLDLGQVKELAQVRLNGQDLGIVWMPPFQVDITQAVKMGENKLEIDVVNFWPNRIIGDARLPEAQRLTQTNVRKLTADTPLMESGLLGPVQVLAPH